MADDWYPVVDDDYKGREGVVGNDAKGSCRTWFGIGERDFYL